MSELPVKSKKLTIDDSLPSMTNSRFIQRKLARARRILGGPTFTFVVSSISLTPKHKPKLIRGPLSENVE